MVAQIDVKVELRAATDRVLASKSTKKLVVAGPGTGKTYLFRELLKSAPGTLKRGPSAGVMAWKVAKAFFAWCEAREDDFAFRLSTTAVSMSLTDSCFSPDSAPRPFHHGFRRRGGTIFRATLPSM